MRIVTWNINSVRLRLDLLKKLIQEKNPDIICLQETKVHDDLFPIEQIKNMGYQYVVFRGEKSYNGVAIISKIPLSNIKKIDISYGTDSRHISAYLPCGTELHNFYIPAGGDEPDPDINPKFKYKLAYVDGITEFFKSNRSKDDKIIILGDFNIAPYENDVWSHKQLLNVVSHTPVEVEKLNKMRSSFNWIDVGRHFVPKDEKLYSWWSYRNSDWKKSNRGRRLDHIWTTKHFKNYLKSLNILSNARDWTKPSDHVPVILDIAA